MACLQVIDASDNKWQGNTPGAAWGKMLLDLTGKCGGSNIDGGKVLPVGHVRLRCVH